MHAHKYDWSNNSFRQVNLQYEFNSLTKCQKAQSSNLTPGKNLNSMKLSSDSFIPLFIFSNSDTKNNYGVSLAVWQHN